jgi:hypothetical protein
VLLAGLLLAAAEHLRALDLPCPTVTEVTAATGASRSRAYELRDAVLAALPSLQRPVGRPPAAPPQVAPERTSALLRAVTNFVMEHPGCVHGTAERRRYGDAFRRFVLDLRDQHTNVDIETFADAILVPLGTLKDWLHTGADVPAEDGALDDDADEDGATGTTPASAQIQLVLSAWEAWHGPFGAFCDHLRDEHRIGFGPGLISDILFVHGKRRPRRRARRSPDERALRAAFQTFFAGAQWVGDGWAVPVTLNGQRFVHNVELVVDSFSDGFVGLSIRDQEDSAAVTEALADGVATTGKAPLALLLDNKPSNHTEEVDAALGDDTLRIRATQARPQNKAHVEGAFGLFQRAIPALDLHAQCPRDLARQILGLVVQTCARVYNHRPRADRGHRSRVQLYNEPVTSEQIDAARAALEARRDKQERARTTLEARQQPHVRALLDDTFARLGLLDPEGHLRAAIARYSYDIVVDAIAIFETKRRLATMPPGADARYLLGIVKNLAEQREGVAIADELLRARLLARDRLLAPLVDTRDAVRVDVPDVRDRVLRFADLALAAPRGIDRLFWLLAVAEEITAHPDHAPAPLVTAAARRIHATHRLPYRERQEAVRAITARVVPLT